VQTYPSQTLSVLNATGYVVAQRKASLASKATGRLEWLGVAEGSVVKAGHESSVAKMSIAKASVAAAKANQQVAEANLSQTEIRAPFDGIILTKNANVGDNITPFSSAADSKGAVVTIADMSTLEVETDVSESNVGRLKIGQPAEIGLDALPGERFAGSIIRMVPTIDRSKATRLVKIKFDLIDPRVLPDMSAKVVFLERQLSEAERKPIVAVSAQAVVQREGKPVVYLVDSGQVKEVVIDTQASGVQGDLVPVANLKPGQRVVIRPAGLRDGQRIKIANP
jgi:RND family efflux transporter MFP subunit